MIAIKKHYEPHIDALRALAIFGVLFHHFEIAFERGGYLGVDVFFVISGYLITRNIISEKMSGHWSFGSFYLRRVRRLLPAYLSIILISLIVGLLLLPVHTVNQLGDNGVFALFHISNLNASPWLDYFDLLDGNEPLLHLWSLNVEEQIYLVWPVLIIVAMFSRRPILPLMVVMAGAASLAVAAYYVDAGAGSRAFFHMEARLFEFCLGAVLLWVPALKRHGDTLYTALAVAGVLLIFSSYWYGPSLQRPFNVLPACLGAMLVIYAGRDAKLGGLFRNRWLVRVGLISYSLYLVHWPIYIYLRYWLYSPYDKQIHLQVTSLVLSFLCALFFYRFIETRFRTRSSGTEKAFDRAPLIFCAAVFASAMALALYAKNEAYDSVRISPPAGIVKTDPDIPRVDEAQCDRYYSELQCDFLGRQGDDIDILVIGDSHQLHLWSLYRKLADTLKVNIAFWSATECPPMFGVPTVRLRDMTEIKRCERVNRRWLERVKSDSPAMVIVAGSWYRRTEDFSGYGTYGVKYEDPEAVIARYYNPAQPDWDRRKTFSQAMTNTVDTLLAHTRRVILVGSIPNIGAIPRDCYLIPNALVSSHRQLARCQQVSYQQMKQKFSFINNVITRLAQDRPQVNAVLLSDVLCDPQEKNCRIVDDRGQVLYTDEQHLSIEGMEFVASRVEAQIARIIRKTGLFSHVAPETP